MKLAGLKIVTSNQTTRRSVAAIIEDALPPPIHAVAGEKSNGRMVRRLNVDEVLARSVPKTIDETLPLKDD